MAEGHFYPGVSGDDCNFALEEYFDNNEIAVYLGDPDTGFTIRFPNVTIPPGSTLLSAHVTLTACNPLIGEDAASCYFNNVDNAVAPTSYAEATGLARTAGVSWNPVPDTTANTPFDTPDLKTILQGIIDRAGWASGNAVQVIVEVDSVVGTRDAYAIDFNSGQYKAELHVTWGETITGALDQNLPALTASATGYDAGIAHQETAILVQNLPALVISASGLVGAIGDLNQVLPSLILEAYGGGYAAITLPMLTLSAEGLTGISGRLIQDLPFLTLSASGLAEQSGSLIRTLPRLVLSSSGVTQVLGALDKILPGLRLSASGFAGSVGAVRATLPPLSLISYGLTETVVNGAMILPALLITAYGEAIPAAVSYKTIVLNPKNLAVSEYSGWAFNSFAFFKGKYLAAGPNGIHVLEGDTDNGAPIVSLIKIGDIPTGMARARDIYLMGRSEAQMRVILTGDEKEESKEEADYLISKLGQDRIVTPLGMEPHYLQIAIENSQGGNFDLDSIQVFGEILKRRQR